MQQIDVDGVPFEVDDSRDGPGFFMMGVRKSGSSMFFKITRQLAMANHINYVDVAGTLFSRNTQVGQWVRSPAINQIIRSGNVYAGFRNFPAGAKDNPIFLEGRKVLLVRDPRDALVSEYFSNAYSHSLPSETSQPGARAALLVQREKALATPLTNYVSDRARMMARTMAEYQPMLADPRCLVFRYEGIIFSKRSMIKRLLAHFGWEFPEARMDALLASVDVRPQTEKAENFIRKVTPGDHKEKLDEATIEVLNAELAGVLQAYGYH